MYRAYLNSQEVDAIFAGNRTALAGIDILRKICNHPDLIERSKWEGSDLYGKPERSGKLTVAMKVGIHCPVVVFSASVFSPQSANAKKVACVTAGLHACSKVLSLLYDQRDL